MCVLDLGLLQLLPQQQALTNEKASLVAGKHFASFINTDSSRLDLHPSK